MTAFSSLFAFPLWEVFTHPVHRREEKISQSSRVYGPTPLVRIDLGESLAKNPVAGWKALETTPCDFFEKIERIPPLRVLPFTAAQ
jgi:hypothetical protein